MHQSDYKGKSPSKTSDVATKASQGYSLSNLTPSLSKLTPASIMQLQKKFGNRAVTQLLRSSIPNYTNTPQSTEKKENKTGFPEHIKSGLEKLSGMDLSDVRVHYNSSKPAGVQALAYAQGNEIHVGSGQERHLSHEGWHVVQQRQGRVKPTYQMDNGIIVNDEPNLEKEAEEIGERVNKVGQDISVTQPLNLKPKANLGVNRGTVQRVIIDEFNNEDLWEQLPKKFKQNEVLDTKKLGRDDLVELIGILSEKNETSIIGEIKQEIIKKLNKKIERAILNTMGLNELILLFTNLDGEEQKESDTTDFKALYKNIKFEKLPNRVLYAGEEELKEKYNFYDDEELEHINEVEELEHINEDEEPQYINNDVELQQIIDKKENGYLIIVSSGSALKKCKGKYEEVKNMLLEDKVVNRLFNNNPRLFLQLISYDSLTEHYGNQTHEVTKDGHDMDVELDLRDGSFCARVYNAREGIRFQDTLFKFVRRKNELRYSLLEVHRQKSTKGTTDPPRVFGNMVEEQRRGFFTAKKDNPNLSYTTSAIRAEIGTIQWGYNVWPKMGFDAPVPKNNLEAMKNDESKKLSQGVAWLKELKVHPYFSDLFTVEDNNIYNQLKELWRIYGGTVDLAYGDKSLEASNKAFDRYKNSKSTT